jgi:hypothetical protein
MATVEVAPFFAFFSLGRYRHSQNKWISHKGNNLLCGLSTCVFDILVSKYQIHEWFIHENGIISFV